MVYYNPHITGQYNPLYTLNNQGFSSMLSCLAGVVLYIYIYKSVSEKNTGSWLINHLKIKFS